MSDSDLTLLANGVAIGAYLLLLTDLLLGIREDRLHAHTAETTSAKQEGPA